MTTAVIGGGLMGIASAYELLERGDEVTLFEAKSGLGEETSFANGGMLTASMPGPWNGPGVAKHLISSLIDPYSPMKLCVSAIPSLMFWGLKFLRNSTLAHYQSASVHNLFVG